MRIIVCTLYSKNVCRLSRRISEAAGERMCGKNTISGYTYVCTGAPQHMGRWLGEGLYCIYVL